jgi:alanine racemase
MEASFQTQTNQRSSQLAGAPGLLTINLAAVRRNYERLSARLAPARAAAVVKADAYGLGAIPIAHTLFEAGCRDFFVAHFEEAEILRAQLPEAADLFVLNGLQPETEHACAHAGIVPVLNSLEQFRRWSATARELGRALPAVLQFDTGMSRLGFAPEDRATLKAELLKGPGLDVLFLMSHLACADEPDNEQNAAQLAEMRRVADEFPGFKLSIANSGGIFLGAKFHGSLARPGVALYGGQPTAERDNAIEPAVRLDVAVIQTRTVPRGARVGYGGTHVTTEDKCLAIVAAGYADGLPRSLSNSGALYFGDTRLPIVGRVSMDSIIVDATVLPPLSLGSWLEVIGPHQTLEDLERRMVILNRSE